MLYQSCAMGPNFNVGGNIFNFPLKDLEFPRLPLLFLALFINFDKFNPITIIIVQFL